MNLKQLFYFTVIAQTKSFSAAARQLGLSQPPLSKQMMALEEELGTSLIHRTARGVELTPAGACLYARAQDILLMLDTARREVQEFPSHLGGTLKLGTVSSSGNILMDDFLQNFCRLHPAVRFEVTEGNTYELLEKLKNGILECAVVRTPFNSEGFVCKYGPREPLVAVAREEYFKNLPQSHISLLDLAGKPLIYYRRFEAIISLAFQNAAATPNIFCRNDDARTCLIWASGGLGVALVPASISKLPIADGLAVKIIDSEDTTTQRAAIYKKNGYASQLAREFVESFANGKENALFKE